MLVSTCAFCMSVPVEATLMEVQPDDGVIQLVAETACIKKRAVETGRVGVRTIVDEEPMIVSATLSGNYVTVDRVKINRVVDC